MRIIIISLVCLLLAGCSSEPTIDLICKELQYDGGIWMGDCRSHSSITCKDRYRCYTFETGTRQLDF